jgi:hypothetical protein
MTRHIYFDSSRPKCDELVEIFFGEFLASLCCVRNESVSKSNSVIHRLFRRVLIVQKEKNVSLQEVGPGNLWFVIVLVRIPDPECFVDKFSAFTCISKATLLR